VDPATLTPNAFVDSDHPSVVAWAHQVAGGLAPRDAAVALTHHVRERLRYTPWNLHMEPEAWRASAVLARPFEVGGHCIDKATLLAAGARVLGIPSRLHFANVRNHVGTARLEERLGTDLLVYHGYTELWLGGRWVAATPAFNAALCERLGVAPLDFDGVHDSVFQQDNREGGRFMEYITDHGVNTTLPWDAMFAAWRAHYRLFREMGVWPKPGVDA
jgi:transglutaminase-like putative cysteine protease